ncbi:glycosyltransferase [Neobacillus sp. LXY-4]|uniref:glycosyltransferase n=1 Tax=Neobacillus sp. LXY-4 TaxID=3379826 RepID=UPI003EDFA35D
MKKILFVIDKMTLGGAEKLLIDIVNNLSKDKYEITVFKLFNGGELDKLINKNVKQISWLKKQHKGIYRVIRYFNPEEIYKRNIKEKFDIEISFKTGMPEKIVAASPNKSSIKIAWIHGDMEYQNYGLESHRTKELQFRCYSKFNKIIMDSQKCENSFKKVVGDFYNFHLIYNGVDLEKVKLLSRENKDIPYNPEKITFSTISRLSYEKGIDRLVLAVEKLVNESINNFEVYIIGGGSMNKQLQEMIHEKNLNNHIFLLGAKHNPYKYLPETDAFILASRTEALCIAIIEAMTLKVPVISTKCGGPEEVLGESEFGVLVENSVEGIYNGMKQFIEREIQIKNLYSDKGAQRSKDFSVQAMISNIEELFDNVSKTIDQHHYADI